MPRGSYLQERISGVTGSIVFAADGRRAVPLGLSRMLVGEPAFGAGGFRYCGSILGSAGDAQFPADERLLERATLLAERVTQAFGLVEGQSLFSSEGCYLRRNEFERAARGPVRLANHERDFMAGCKDGAE